MVRTRLVVMACLSAAGFLYSHLMEQSLEESLAHGNQMASEIIQVYGTGIS